jgi:hypothetical protein
VSHARRVRATVAVVAVGVIAALAWALERPSPASVGGNGVAPAVFVVDLKPGHIVCGPLGPAARPADELLVTVGTYGRQPQALQVSVDGRDSTAQRHESGRIGLPLPRSAVSGGARACIRNEGSYRVAIAGMPGRGARLDGRPMAFAVSFVLKDSNPPSWLNRAPTIVRKVGDAPGAPFGPGTGWLAALALAMGLTASFVAAWRTLSR